MNGRVEEFLISRARKIERALVRKSWTRVHLAELTGYDERTIRNVLGAKPVRDQTIIDICQALGIEPELEDSSEYVEVEVEVPVIGSTAAWHDESSSDRRRLPRRASRFRCLSPRPELHAHSPRSSAGRSGNHNRVFRAKCYFLAAAGCFDDTRCRLCKGSGFWC